jgi:hypothetical protein
MSSGGAFTTSTVFGHHSAPDTSGVLPYPGSSPVISWNAAGGVNTDAILWILETNTVGSAPTRLYAYQATPESLHGLFKLLWNDTSNGPWATKFMVPTVANGRVYVGGEKPDPLSQCTTAYSGGSCLGRVVSYH